MTTPLHLSLVIALAGLLVAAVSYDLKVRRIPNWLILTGSTVGLVLSSYIGGLEALRTSAFGFATGFLLLLPGFLLRFTGAGDVKLMATLGIYLGPDSILQVFLLSAMFGAVFILVRGLLRIRVARVKAHLARYFAMIRRGLGGGGWAYQGPSDRSTLGMRLPMAPLFASAVLGLLALRWAAGSMPV